MTGNNMSPLVLLAALGGLSIFVAIEAVWLHHRILPESVRRRLEIPAVRGSLLAIYAIGFPYFALTSGLVPARFLGLRGWDTLASAFFPQPVSQFLPNFFIAVGDTLYLWLSDFGSIITTFSILGGMFILFLTMLRKGTPITAIHRPSAFETLFDAVHWGFYRAVLWRLMGNLYLSVLGGILLVALEWIAVARAGRLSGQENRRFVLRFALGLIGGIAFIFAPNLWLVGVAQWVLWWAIFLAGRLWQPQPSTAG